MFLKPDSPSATEHTPHRNLFTPGAQTQKIITPQSAIETGPLSNLPIIANQTQGIALHSDYGYPPEFIQNLTRTIAHAKSEGALSALFIVSINNLAMIMNAYGHEGAEKDGKSAEKTGVQSRFRCPEPKKAIRLRAFPRPPG